MIDHVYTSKLRNCYYKIYRKIILSSQWIRSIYKSTYPMTVTHLSPIIFSVRKIAHELLDLADELENNLHDTSKM